jgi:hypothetical protein
LAFSGSFSEEIASMGVITRGISLHDEKKSETIRKNSMNDFVYISERTI